MGPVPFMLGIAMATSATWGVTPFDAADDVREDVDTLRLMLVTELEALGVPVDRRSEQLEPCGAPGCARRAAAALSAEKVVAGTVSRFGGKLLVTTLLVDAEGEATSQKIVIDRIEDFDVASKRIATAIVEERSVDDTIRLGEITALETERARRRRGTGGLTLGLGPTIPLENTYAGNTAGLALQLGYWFETKSFALETTLGFRFSSDTDGERRFFDVPLSLGGYWVAGLGDFAPFIGGGVAVRYIYEARPGTVRVGEVIVTENEGEISDDSFAPSLFAKAGILILRTYRVRASVSVAYEASFVDLNDQGYPQTLLVLAGIHF